MVDSWSDIKGFYTKESESYLLYLFGTKSEGDFSRQYKLINYRIKYLHILFAKFPIEENDIYNNFEIFVIF
ncbi:MAG: hypothetical protein C6Y22_06500 [Hapalosiphonaceae cyanobacterium JJU2]|nr:MAG: hypothetical protein C6Y22_06500 [Hapalosiphonaceae cyanobacterium JJU2]